MADTAEEHDLLGYYCKVRDGAMNTKTKIGVDFTSKISYREDCQRNYEEENEEEDAVEKDVVEVCQLLTKLGRVVPYVISGQCQLHYYPILVKFLDGTNQVVFDPHQLDVPKLLEQCEPSPYGDFLRNETRFDPSVRMAMEIAGSRISFSFGAFSSQKNSISEQLRPYLSAKLLDGMEIDLVLNKLNVYSAGGHFKPHTDTPTHDPARFLGSLVVCLPSEHTGGELVVRHANQEQVFDFAPKSSNKEILQFVAFYGDCEHEVKPVLTGHRVVLTYSILKSDRTPNRYTLNKKGITCEVFGTRAISEALNTMYEKLHKTFANQQVGFFLSHAYTDTGLRAVNLKGVDKLLYDYLVSQNVPVSLLPVVSHVHYSDYFDVEGAERYNMEVRGASFEVRLLKGFTDGRIEAHRNIPNDIPFLTAWDVKGIEIENHTDHGHYGGNEYQPNVHNSVYIQGALIAGPFQYASESSVVCEDLAK